jgi:hypothetical protein
MLLMQKRMRFQPVIAGIALIFVLGVVAEGICQAGVPSGLEQGGRVAIVVDKETSRQLHLALIDLESYLQRSVRAIVRRYAGPVEAARVPESVVIVVGERGSDAGILSRTAGIDLTGPPLGPEGCRVKSGASGGKLFLFLVGDTLVGASHAVYSFLEKEVGIGFFIDGDQVPQLDGVRLNGIDRIETPAVSIRGLFFHYIWKHPHANCWRLWSWEGWRNSIDWMRRKRFNTLPLFHDEGGYLWGDVIFKAFPEIPQNDETLSQFVVDPAWRTELNKRIIAYARESGIRIAYNLFYSQVPEFFADFHPELKYHDLNMRNVGISAIQPECKQIMKRYWKAILDTYGIDDSHLYFVCSYRHERNLPPYYEDHNEPTLQALEVLKELDPQAQMFIESWCWKYKHEKTEERTIELLTANVGKNWKAFDRGIPKEVGVVEWDLHRNHGDGLPEVFEGRRYLQLVHTNMEGWWPPSTTRNPPQWLVDYFAKALQNRAEGFLFFHIQAGNTEINADLAAALSWTPKLDLDHFYRDYARRRFGEEAAAPLAESLRLFCDVADFGATSKTRDVFVTLSFPGFDGSAETQLRDALTRPVTERKRWIQERLQEIGKKAELAGKALLMARSAAPTLTSQEFYQRHLWELDYLAARFEGITSLYKAHLCDGAQAELLFERAVNAFGQIKELFRHRKDYHMSEIRNLEPDVPYTAAFLRDWETRGFWEPRSKSFHVVWERIPEFEQLLLSLRPSRTNALTRNRAEEATVLP